MASKYRITTQAELRRVFWAEHTDLSRRREADGDYCCDTRVTFCDWIDELQKDGQISEALASRVTLG